MQAILCVPMENPNLWRSHFFIFLHAAGISNWSVDSEICCYPCFQFHIFINIFDYGIWSDIEWGLFFLVGIGYTTILHMDYAEFYKLFEADEHCIGLFVGPWFDPYIPPVDILQLSVHFSTESMLAVANSIPFQKPHWWIILILSVVIAGIMQVRQLWFNSLKFFINPS